MPGQKATMASRAYLSRCDDCKWGQEVLPPERRRSDRPHEPKPKAHAEPTVGILATIDGHEIARAAEDEVAEHDRRIARESSSSSSSSPAAVAAEPAREEAPGDAGEDAEQRRSRGPDLAPRHRRVWREQGDSPDRLHDWTHFDIGRVAPTAKQPSDLHYASYLFGGGMPQSMS